MKTICIALFMVAGWLNASAQATPPAAPQAPGAGNSGLLTNANPNLASNLPPFALTNRFGLTNDLRGSNVFVNFGITNTLSTLSPERVHAVREVQASLDLLQQAATKLRNTPNVQQAIDQSPSLQQQIRIISTELDGLTQGTVRPSPDVVGRLSQNLVRAFVSTQLVEDQHLVLSTAISQIANSGNLTLAQIDESISTVQAVLQFGGAPMVVVAPVTRDLRAFALELQPKRAQ